MSKLLILPILLSLYLGSIPSYTNVSKPPTKQELCQAWMAGTRVEGATREQVNAYCSTN